MIFELIQIALGNKRQLERQLSPKEWREIFEQSLKQAIVGIAFCGVQKLSREQWPPKQILFEWMGLAEQIKRRYAFVDKQTAIIWKKLHEDGLDVAILKGQGIATLYGELAPYRQSGDIDVWVKCEYQIICDYIQRTHPTDDVAYHRFHYNYFDDTEVELHHRPTLMRNLFDDRKLTRWFESYGQESFIYLKEKGFAIPSLDFNRIFILTHIYRHFLFEGIGLRQIIDYYFVLKAEVIFDKDRIVKTLKDLRLTKFAEAMMWILHTQLGLEEKYLICGMNEKEGRFVFNEILETGNFGQADTRYRYRRFFKLRHHIAHGSHLMLHYPSEVIWTPIWLVYHKAWKWNKKRKIRQSWI